jgi:hypothetical protein
MNSRAEVPIPHLEQFMMRICIGVITRGFPGALLKIQSLAEFLVRSSGMFLGYGSAAASSETTLKPGSVQIATIRPELHFHQETPEPQPTLAR